MGKKVNSDRFFPPLGLQNHCRQWLQPWNKTLAPWKESSDKPRQHIKKQRNHFADKGPYSLSYGFSSSHVQMGELDCRESWVPKNCHFQTVVLEKTLESPLDSKKIKPVNPKRNQSWIFIERTYAETKAPVLWAPDGKSWLGKDADAEKDWRQKGMTDGWMASLIQWTWVWAQSVTWGRTEKPATMRLQRAGHDWATEQQMFLLNLEYLHPLILFSWRFPVDP